ncbi:MAG: molybdenum cofactor biosynthesis protein MoaE [Rhodobacteraceae bacterium]|nr:molybdenum cofactor biosynthesis protein MoaE [Paracoccaceae bacterium]
MPVRIQAEPFDAGAELNRLGSGSGIGATACFVGVVRSSASKPVDKLVIEHYPGMTDSAVRSMLNEAVERWSLAECLIIHRFGELLPGEPIMMVAVQSAHRAEAFDAAAYLMDYLKSRAPFWKKEHYAGRAEWVECRNEDEAALARWLSE